MSRFFRCCLAAGFVALALPVAAQTLKPGLWEINNKTSSPQMDQAMADMQKSLAAMPPAQRKQMEDMMAQRGMKMTPGAGGGMAVQICMTREMVERDQVPMQQDSRCKITQQQKSGNTMTMAYACTEPPSTGEGTFTYISSEAYSSKMVMKRMVQGKPETMTMEGAGKWLKADCGNVKPFTAASAAAPAPKK